MTTTPTDPTEPSILSLLDFTERLAAFDSYHFGDESDLINRRRWFILKLIPQLTADAKLLAEALVGESAKWFRPDWTNKSFLEATENLTDAERCVAALNTRDVGIISWFVNARAGRKITDHLSVTNGESQRKINQSEVDEIEAALQSGNSADFLDAIADVMLTTAGFAGRVEFNVMDNFIEMIEANFTRIASTRAQAELTQKHWTDRGVPCKIIETELGTFPVVVTEEVTIGTERYPVDKFLKGTNFRDNTPSQTVYIEVDTRSDEPAEKQIADAVTDRHNVAQTFDGR